MLGSSQLIAAPARRGTFSLFSLPGRPVVRKGWERKGFYAVNNGYFSVKDFSKFQHYKDRDPRWIKLYRYVLDDYGIGALPDASKAHLFAIWLLAARYQNRIPYDARWVGGKVQATEPVDLELLEKAGFIIKEQDDTLLLAEAYQNRDVEKRREEQSREEQKEDIRPTPVASENKTTSLAEVPPPKKPNGLDEKFEDW